METMKNKRKREGKGQKKQFPIERASLEEQISFYRAKSRRGGTRSVVALWKLAELEMQLANQNKKVMGLQLPPIEQNWKEGPESTTERIHSDTAAAQIEASGLSEEYLERQARQRLTYFGRRPVSKEQMIQSVLGGLKHSMAVPLNYWLTTIEKNKLDAEKLIEEYQQSKSNIEAMVAEVGLPIKIGLQDVLKDGSYVFQLSFNNKSHKVLMPLMSLEELKADTTHIKRQVYVDDQGWFWDFAVMRLFEQDRNFLKKYGSADTDKNKAPKRRSWKDEAVIITQQKNFRWRYLTLKEATKWREVLHKSEVKVITEILQVYTEGPVTTVKLRFKGVKCPVKVEFGKGVSDLLIKITK